jgi:low affinity Fe/Cu permease
MTKRRNNTSAASSAATALRRAGRDAKASTSTASTTVPNNGNGAGQMFSHLASRTAHLAGKPLTFLIAVAVVLVWAVSGPLFGFSDTWQLVINTSTTIITFLMVFLIQNTQNRDTLALQLKLAELIIAAQGAKNNLATAEDLCEEDLERLHETYRKRAEETLDHLERRRGQLKQAS